MQVLGGEPRLVTFGVALLWIPGVFCLIAAVILAVVGARLRRGGQVAAKAGTAKCAQVRAGTPAVHLAGVSAPGPRGLLAAPVSGRACVWYRSRLYRIYEGVRWREADGWHEVPSRAQEQIWEQESGPFSLRDDSGAVLITPVLVDRRTTSEYPKETAVDDAREQGPQVSLYEQGPAGALAAAGLLPAGLLDRFAAPDARTCGYWVTEEIVRPGVPFRLFAIAAEHGGQPIMVPVGNVPAISVGGMTAVLARGGRSSAMMALCFGMAGAACFALSALLLVFRSHLAG